VILEIGRKKRVVAGAMDWPGLDRWGTTEDGAIETLLSYRPRYAGVAERAGLTKEFAQAGDPVVVERVPGVGSTDFWGIAHAPSEIEREVLSKADLDRRLDLLSACWAYFDDVAGRVSPELRLGPRGGGRTRDQIIGHVHRVEPGQFSGKVEVRTPIDVGVPAAEVAAFREEFLAAIRTYNAEGKPARTWPIQFLIRRVAHHAMDHAWEMEDRDLTPS
jgi:hypothetical protein